ncbi:E3 ubiquitin-protein ligase RNF144B-like [Ylistrum balloti]|uniref:E3 ubiquitin-protein ligase RNF144B-like n=1 Tax=Ylistrum balloti TaxID=509963 RepID=UPI002905EED6|nr:E3 ubiquitin-protein ligase RNF144B-like [Ylistrum balloti]
MTTYINIGNLSGDPRYERRIGLQIQKIRKIGDLKLALEGPLGLPRDRYDVIKMREALLYDEAELITPTVWSTKVVLVIHPCSRPVYDHLKTSETDIVNGDFEDEQRTIMSCGHGIVPETLYDYCWNGLKQGGLEIKCPAIEEFRVRGTQTTCGSLWTLYELTVKAQLSQDERILFEMKLSKNSLMKMEGVQECPFCRSIAVRDNVSNDRVLCINCCNTNPDNAEFCWQCLHPWKTTNTNYCGNLSCSTSKGPKATQEILRTCPSRSIGGHKRTTPIVRACPSCQVLVEHTSGCKQMTCKCQYIFCFICLQPWKQKGVNGGCDYSINCDPAPYQSV